VLGAHKTGWPRPIACSENPTVSREEGGGGGSSTARATPGPYRAPATVGNHRTEKHLEIQRLERVSVSLVELILELNLQ
jgi:hypothetical protein